MKRLFIGLCLVSCSWTLFGQNLIGDKEDIDQILMNSKMFSSYIINADYEKIADAYTADGKIFPNRMNIIAGREQIKRYWILPDGVKTLEHEVIPREIKVMGLEAYDYGTYRGVTKRANGNTVPWQGKYVIIWRKEDGDWKMYLDIWNSTDSPN